MLRLPPFQWHRPGTVEEAVSILRDAEGTALPVAGGTDLVPNMKHGLFEPAHLVSLTGIEGFADLDLGEGETTIGAGVSLADLSRQLPVGLGLGALGEAAGHVAGPQLRNRATLGGNLCLDTRCTYYNQTRFWRDALGYCLKKDGDTCHVTRVGRKCVAAHSADTPPVLEVLEAEVDLHGPEGARTVPVSDFFVADGIWNSRRDPGEIVTRIRIPKGPTNRRTTYGKLRQRNAIDFPLLTVAVSVDGDPEGEIEAIRVVVTALGSRPKRLTRLDEVVGRPIDDEVVDFVCERGWAECHPLENIIVDPEWRRAMVPVQLRRAFDRLRGADPRA